MVDEIVSAMVRVATFGLLLISTVLLVGRLMAG